MRRQASTAKLERSITAEILHAAGGNQEVPVITKESVNIAIVEGLQLTRRKLEPNIMSELLILGMS